MGGIHGRELSRSSASGRIQLAHPTIHVLYWWRLRAADALLVRVHDLLLPALEVRDGVRELALVGRRGATDSRERTAVPVLRGGDRGLGGGVGGLGGMLLHSGANGSVRIVSCLARRTLLGVRLAGLTIRPSSRRSVP